MRSASKSELSLYLGSQDKMGKSVSKTEQQELHGKTELALLNALKRFVMFDSCLLLDRLDELKVGEVEAEAFEDCVAEKGSSLMLLPKKTSHCLRFAACKEG